MSSDAHSMRGSVPDDTGGSPAQSDKQNAAIRDTPEMGMWGDLTEFTASTAFPWQPSDSQSTADDASNGSSRVSPVNADSALTLSSSTALLVSSSKQSVDAKIAALVLRSKSRTEPTGHNDLSFASPRLVSVLFALPLQCNERTSTGIEKIPIPRFDAEEERK